MIRQFKYKSSTKGTKFDNWVDYLRKENDARAERISTMYRELDDALLELEKQNASDVAELEADALSKEEQIRETVRSIAEYEVNSLKAAIEQADALLSRYKEIANLLESVDLGTLKKYNILELFGLDNGVSDITDFIVSQVEAGVQEGETKISELVKAGEAYEALSKAADENDFRAIFAQYDGQIGDDAQEKLENIIDRLNEGDYTLNEWVNDWHDGFNDVISSLVSTIDEVQELKDNLRENVYFKAINRAIELTDKLQSKISSIAGVIKDDWTSDINGLTSYGLAKINLLGQELTQAQNQVSNYAALIQQIEANRDTYATEDDYLDAITDATQEWYSSLSNVESIMDQVYQLAKKQQEAEVNQVKKVVEAYRGALSSKKSYYEYDKSLKAATKTKESLEAQLAALNNIEGAYAKAQRAALTAQLAEANEQIEDIKLEHQFDLEDQALSELVERLEEALDTTGQTIQETFEEFSSVVTDALNSSALVDTSGALQNIYSLLMSNGGALPITTAPIVSSEVRTTSGGTVVSASGTSYTPIDLDAFLSKLAPQFDSSIEKVIPSLTEISDWSKVIQNSLTKSLIPSVEALVNKQQPVNVDVHYDSALTVNGAVDATVLRDMRQFSNDIINRTRSTIYNDLRQLGLFTIRH